MLDSQLPVARIVLDHSECAPILQRHRIDFCCRGDMTVDAACKERGLETASVLRELETAIASRRGAPAEDPRAVSTTALVALIVDKHHEYLRQALPFVRAVGAKVAGVHGDHNPKLRTLRDVVVELADALEPHLDAEEQTLFPALTAPSPDRALVARALATMREEHLAVGPRRARVRARADDYAVPEWACNSYRALFSELAELEGDVLRHVHLENHVLMPRFVEA